MQNTTIEPVLTLAQATPFVLELVLKVFKLTQQACAIHLNVMHQTPTVKVI
jgi:hypothetical protein